MTQHDFSSAEPSSVDVDNRLKTLKDGAFFDRKKAVDDLARLPESSEQVISALMQAAQTDRDPAVRNAALQALESPVHAQYLQGRTRLAAELEAVKRNHAALESAARQAEAESTLPTPVRLLRDIGGLIVGITILFWLTPELPDAYRSIGSVVVFVVGLVYIGKKYVE